MLNYPSQVETMLLYTKCLEHSTLSVNVNIKQDLNFKMGENTNSSQKKEYRLVKQEIEMQTHFPMPNRINKNQQ